MTEIKLYKVGGAIRDKFLNIPSKDLDYAVECESFNALRDYIVNERKGKIYEERLQYLTIRAKIEGLGDADFVICRKDGIYNDNRHPEDVQIGTIYDDLKRRDFCCNAIAIDEQGNILDPHNGIQDIKDKLIRCVGKAEERFEEDSLRLIRCLRFSITKNFGIDSDIDRCLMDDHFAHLLSKISVDRIRDELYKCFKYNTIRTLTILEFYWKIKEVCFDKTGIWLEPTNKK